MNETAPIIHQTRETGIGEVLVDRVGVDVVGVHTD